MHIYHRFAIGALIFIALVSFADYIYFDVFGTTSPPYEYVVFALLMGLTALIFPVDRMLRRMK